MNNHQTPSEMNFAFDSDLLGDIDVWTPAADRATAKVSHLIRIDIPGASMFGAQRIGKTHACKFICKALPSFFDSALGCLHVTIGDPPEKTVRAFIQDLLVQVGCNAILSRDPVVLRGRLIDYLYDYAIAAGSKRLVLLIDEAHNLEKEHYGWLMTVFNHMVGRNLRPFFLLVGQPELRDINAAFRLARLQQIVGRFFNHEIEFLGLSTSELEIVLRALDFEDGTVEVGPRHFMPIPYAEGFELAKLAEPLAIALETVRATHKLTQGVRIPMQYLRSVVIEAMIRIIRGEIDHRNISAMTMLDCLSETGFLNVVVMYAELEAKA